MVSSLYGEIWGNAVTEQPFSYSKNLIARLEGTSQPDRVFVVGAHYDTVSNTFGADDNASGVAGMLELARILAGMRLSHTIEFVAFSLEELGLWGSYHYVDMALAEHKDIVGMVNFEMIGYACRTPNCQDPVYGIPGCFRVDPEGVNVGNYGAICVNATAAPLLTNALYAVDNYVSDFDVVTMLVLGSGECAGAGWNFTRRSDHVPFWEADIPAIEFFDTYNLRNPLYHTWNDTLESLDMPLCRHNVQTGLAVVLLNMDSITPRRRIGGIEGVPKGLVSQSPPLY
jgi:Zn-dependent M28 family amino/carboxypeptidase